MRRKRCATGLVWHGTPCNMRQRRPPLFSSSCIDGRGQHRLELLRETHMSRVFEMSLNTNTLVARELMQQTVEQPAARKTASARAKRTASGGVIGEAMAEALDHVVEFAPQLSLVSARTPLTIYPLALSRKLAEAGWRASVEAS